MSDSNFTPKKVKAKITRTVVETAIVTLDKHGNVDEFVETFEELDHEVTDVMDIISVISFH
jgi:predicted transcriptional regulator